MCCFSQQVEVSQTQIFARMGARGRQLLAYQMQFESSDPVAMVLPLPTPPFSADDAVRFISLEAYPDLFDDLFRIFHPPSRGGGTKSYSAFALAVHVVGDFIASFVPSLADFSRLDARFRMPAGTLDKIPELSDWGFAVFQLHATKGASRPHPMAFEFPSRDATRLFFPTLHVHDGALHAEAEFDHTLYAQGVDQLRTFTTSQHELGPIVAQRSAGVLDGREKISRRTMSGTLPNKDTWFTLLDAR
ncbi:MAG: hypothetical protein ABI175_19030 [Polyangiales bacterium]